MQDQATLTDQPQAPLTGWSLAHENTHHIHIELDLDNRTLLEFCDRHLLSTRSVFQVAWAVVASSYAGVEDVSFVYGSNVGQSYLCHVQIRPKTQLLDTILIAEKYVHSASDHNDCSNAKCPNESLGGVASTFDSSLRVNYQLGEQVDQAKQNETLSRCQVLVQFFVKSDTSLALLIHAHASNFSASHVGDVAHTLRKTLNEIVKARPETLIEDLDICSQRDLRRIMSWNQSAPETVESCFHWLFEAAAQKTPDATAICSWDQSFTYQELDTVSTKLANKLRYLGVTPGTFVGICFNKTSMVYACMLGILKAGGAFVAIDPSHPASRIQTIVEATKASIFLAEPMYCHLFDEFSKSTMAIDFKSIDELPDRSSLPRTQMNPSDVAYAVFTSGSTGLPKGIVIEHRSLCSAAVGLASPLKIDSRSRVLQFAAYTFDVSYGDIFVTLAQGGCICVPSEHERINDISGAIVRMDVNNACVIPSVARTLRPEDVPCLKTLNLGGEALVKDNLDTWAENLTLSVVYGPSECTVWCASETGLKVDSPHNTIGRGTGALLWITSANNYDRLCPIGCIGELLIEGPGLARGYLDAEQTRDAFIENPSWAQTEPGQRRRFYKTGDLVRYQSDGSLAFIGRKDTQIKLHGRRIELGEIEYHLSCHDLLKQSIVLLPSAGKHRQKLVAIMVFKTSVTTDMSSTTTELKPLSDTAMHEFVSDLANIKAFLSTRIPSYMLPQEWIVVKAIPLMTSGKMNRVLSRSFVESLTTDAIRENAITNDDTPHPRDHVVTNHQNLTITEAHLQQIWSQVLSINPDGIGLDTSFLGLGGDSLSAMELVACCKADGYNISNFTVADVLSNDSTIRQMAAATEMEAAIGSAHEDKDKDKDKDNIQSLRDKNHHKIAISRPLILRPVWWDTD